MVSLLRSPIKKEFCWNQGMKNRRGESRRAWEEMKKKGGSRK
jgi:hypothetical protein